MEITRQPRGDVLSCMPRAGWMPIGQPTSETRFPTCYAKARAISSSISKRCPTSARRAYALLQSHKQLKGIEGSFA